MQLPKRRSQQMRQHGPESDELTAETVERLKRTLNDLIKNERPKIVVDLSHAISLGDFSENAEYQDAKAKLARMDGRIFSLQERIKHAVVIPSGAGKDGAVRVGSNVRVRMNGKSLSYRLLGSQESNPSRGDISYLSPLGAALIGRKQGEAVTFRTPSGSETEIEILEVD